jgi:hypothetical protein
LQKRSLCTGVSSSLLSSGSVSSASLQKQSLCTGVSSKTSSQRRARRKSYRNKASALACPRTCCGTVSPRWSGCRNKASALACPPRGVRSARTRTRCRNKASALACPLQRVFHLLKCLEQLEVAETKPLHWRVLDDGQVVGAERQVVAETKPLHWRVLRARGISLSTRHTGVRTRAVAPVASGAAPRPGGGRPNRSRGHRLGDASGGLPPAEQ